MGICASKGVTSTYSGDSPRASSVDATRTDTSATSTRPARSSMFGGLSQRSSATRSSQWSTVRSSIRLSDPNDSRLVRALDVLGAIYRSSPAFRAIADRVRNEGGVEIREGDVNVAQVDLTNRVIRVSPQTLSNRGEGDGPSLVSALVYELNNLSRDEEQQAVFGLARMGALDASRYATELERIEYGSGQSSAQIFQEARGALRSFGEADHPYRWFLNENDADGSLQPMFHSFEDSLGHQQDVGHAGRYEDEFRHLFNPA